MNLYAGKLLVADLTTRSVKTIPLNPNWIRKYWGSWGLALRYYWDSVSPKVNPLGRENAIVIMTGPLCGTLVPMTSRLCLVSKSPLTGTIFESNIGGAFGPELKFAGYDGIIIKGRADTPVYLKIVDDEVSLENACEMYGLGIFETEKMLVQTIGDPSAKTLAIGPAAENQIPYSIVGSEYYRQFGRGGSGALFGAKNLKGIVCRGSGSIRVAKMTKFIAQLNHHKNTNLFTDDNLALHYDGSPVLVDITNEMGVHPTRNYTEGVNTNSQSLNADAIRDVKLGDRACTSCPLACGKFTRIGESEVEGPEYETLCLGGSNCGINDLSAVIRFNRICDDLGLDTMSCGSTIALAMEMGQSHRHDFGLRFGETEAYLSVLDEIAHLSTQRGRDLAMGAKALAKKYKAEDLSMEVKGMEIPAYEPRANYGMGISYATSERGACHLRAFTVFSEDPFNISEQVGDIIAAQNFAAIKWSMGFCDFWGTLDTDIMAELLNTGLGEVVTKEELNIAGERIWNIARLFNVRAGFTAAHDTLPEKIMKSPLRNGPHAGRVFAQRDFEAGLAEYYRLRSWNKAGNPTPEKLAELQLNQL
jgi:aldehyde:ferredoxin oxidoreductase